MSKYLYIVIILFISCNQNNVAKSVELTVSLDTNYTTIGTPVSYSIYIKSPKDKIIEFPDWILEDPIEIRSRFLDTISSSNNVDWPCRKIYGASESGTSLIIPS